jgi:hypothetical protein
MRGPTWSLLTPTRWASELLLCGHALLNVVHHALSVDVRFSQNSALHVAARRVDEYIRRLTLEPGNHDVQEKLSKVRCANLMLCDLMRSPDWFHGLPLFVRSSRAVGHNPQFIDCVRADEGHP